MNAAIEELVAELGDDVVATDDISERYRTDWTGTSPTAPAALVRPRTTEQVAAALAICDRHGQTVVTQGGLTGLAGGAVPRPGDVALSLERMTGIDEIDHAAATMTVRAGTTLEAAQHAALDAGFELTYDLGARGTATVGGNVATNAGGNRVIRYGMTREHVLGLEGVLADGTVVSSLNKLLKNNAGYDLKQLFIGTEGTLGVVTRVVFRLRPAPTSRTTALLACPDYDAVLANLSSFRRVPHLSAFEVMWPSYYDVIAERRGGITPPIDIGSGRAAVIELSGDDPDGDLVLMESMIGEAIAQETVTDAFLARSAADTEAIWAMREAGPTDGIVGLQHFDVGLPTGDIDRFVATVERRLAEVWPDVVVYAFGHIADGNVHCNPTVGTDDHDVVERMESIVYDTVAEFAGSVSAEHGIGTVKKPYLDRSRSATEIALMRRLKDALDPNGILNPGKVV
ncbi:MAG: FAD-binding oxidoreductase [Ilumatobacter sp.]|nr:FAD-binding oxidoreductase [Ilumatobacter sp.]